MSKRLITMLAGVAALAILVAGCGGSDDEGGLSKAEYVKKGTVICERTLKEMKVALATLAKEEQKDGKPPQEESAMEFVEEQALPAYEAQLAELRELPAPEADEEELNAIYDQMQQGLDLIQKNNEKFFQLTNKSLDEARKDAETYGLEGCMLVLEAASVSG